MKLICHYYPVLKTALIHTFGNCRFLVTISWVNHSLVRGKLQKLPQKKALCVPLERHNSSVSCDKCIISIFNKLLNMSPVFIISVRDIPHGILQSMSLLTTIIFKGQANEQVKFNYNVYNYWHQMDKKVKKITHSLTHSLTHSPFGTLPPLPNGNIMNPSGIMLYIDSSFSFSS